MPEQPRPTIVRNRVALAALTVLSAAGCTGGAPAPLDTATSSAALTTPTCAGHRVVALHDSPSDPCRIVSGVHGRWVGQPVLRTRESTYCTYRWITDNAGTLAPPDLGVLVSQKEDFDLDCPVAAPAAPAPPAAPPPDWRPLQRNTAVQAGAFSPLPPDDPRGRIRVAVIDTAARAYGDSASDRDGHGRAVGRVIADLSCNDPRSQACLARMQNELAFPQVSETTTDFVNGGHFGSRGDLARAIGQALDDWQAADAADPLHIDRLVMVLSLGWEQVHEQGARKGPNRPPLTSDAVRLALTRASCLGALVVAAAGNAIGLDSKGPLYPAAWEAVAAPDGLACGRLGWDVPAHDLSAAAVSYRPLVYAVGALDEGDRPLPTTRPGSQPRVAAFGSGVVAADWRPGAGGRTLVQSGTSMATAVAAGVATAAWAHAPELTAHHLMNAVYGSGVDLTPTGTTGALPVELCLGGGPCPGMHVRRASVCNAVAAVSGPPAPACATVPAGGGKAANLMPGPTLPPSLGTAACGTPDCGLSGDVASIKPWVGPQPGWPRCDVCFLSIGWNWLGVWLAPGVGPDLQTLVLTTFAPSGIVGREIVKPPGGYPPSFWVSAPVPADTLGATLTFYMDFYGLTITSQEAIIVQ